MSSIRTTSGVSTNGAADEPSIHTTSRSVSVSGGSGEIVDFGVAGARSSDPNESFELRDMVGLASTYFERGMIDDAEEMLREALESGYSRSDALELNQRIQAIRHQDALAMTSPEPEEPAIERADVVLDEFTRPLPGADAQPPNIRKAIEDSERDIDAGRLQSALDATMYA
ncbi:MAG: hypothetical protein ACRD1H_10375, partial [Vicinamibacterales bacterium]